MSTVQLEALATDAAPATKQAPPATRRRPGAPEPRTVLGVASLGFFLAFLDATIVNIAVPDIALSFPDQSLSALSWVLNACNVIFAAFLLPAARLADSFGRKKVFVRGLWLFGIASVGAAIAPSLTVLVVFRTLQAVGAAAMVPAGLALVLDAYDADGRAHAVALIAAIGALAAGLGPSVGGLLIAAADWRLVFAINVPAVAAIAVVARRRLVESRVPGRRRLPDLLGATALAVACGALVLGIVQGQDWGWANAGTIAAFVVAALAGALVVGRSRTHRFPVVDPALLRHRTFVLANAVNLLGGIGFFGYTLLNVLWLTRVWDYSVLEAGLAITPGPIVAMIVAGPASHLAERVGYRYVLLVGGLIWGAGLLWFVTQVGLAPDFTGEWLPGMAILGVGAGIAFPNVSAAAIASAPGDTFAVASGINSVTRQVGGAIGVALAVAILGTPTSAVAAAEAFDDAWLFAACCLALVGIGSLGLGRIAATADRSPTLGDAVDVALRREPTAPPAPQRPAPAYRPAPPAPESTRQPETMAEFLGRRVPLFADLDPEHLTVLAAASRTRRLERGETLYEVGDDADAMYVVHLGRIEAIDVDGTVVHEVGRGGAIGELALLTGRTRAAAVRAVRPSELIEITGEAFSAVRDRTPCVDRAIAVQLARQLQNPHKAHAPRPLPVTILIAVVDRAVDHREVTTRLRDELSRVCRCAVLDCEDAPAGAWAPSLDRAEHDADTVLLAFGPDADDGWQDFCLAQADRLLVVSTAAEPEPFAADAVRGCDYVAWGSANAELAARLEPLTCHYVADGDVRRLARSLTGRSVGLVLSGGGARALAHIGVVEELEAAGIVIDRIGGVSMGAWLGANFALGRSPEEVDAWAYEEWVRRYPLNDWRLPRYALIHGQRFYDGLHRTFGDALIEEAPRGYYCVSADILHTELVVHRSGSLRDHMTTTMAVPLLAPPQRRANRVLIDGGFMNNLPIQTMSALGEGPIIAVDVRAGGGGDRKRRPGERPERSRMAGGFPTPPQLGETLGRVFLLASENTANAAGEYADFVIEPKAPGVGLLEFHQIDRAVEAGRQAARAALASAPACLWG